MMHRALLLPIITLTLAACTEGTLLHCYKPLPADGWDRRDTICFDVPEAETDISGTLFVGLRTTANIGIRDIVIAVEQTGETLSRSRVDTIRYALTDAEGKALTGGVNTHQYETQHIPFHIQKGQSCTVRIHHLMTREVIPGFTEVGIRISQD